MKVLLLLLLSLLPVTAEMLPVYNRYVLDAVQSMPKGKGYEASQLAVDRLAASVILKDGYILQSTNKAGACFCSGATYLVFLRVVEKLRAEGKLTLSRKALTRLANLDQKDGEGVFGRWNANGPGTARLFTELKCGSNFTSFEKARCGDFLKIWWTSEIGAKERGHLVVYLGQKGSKVGFWSANQPGGYGVKWIPRSKVKRALFSRLENPAHLQKVSRLPRTSRFLADMLRKRFTWSEVVRKCAVK